MVSTATRAMDGKSLSTILTTSGRTRAWQSIAITCTAQSTTSLKRGERQDRISCPCLAAEWQTSHRLSTCHTWAIKGSCWRTVAQSRRRASLSCCKTSQSGVEVALTSEVVLRLEEPHKEAIQVVTARAAVSGPCMPLISIVTKPTHIGQPHSIHMKLSEQPSQDLSPPTTNWLEVLAPQASNLIALRTIRDPSLTSSCDAKVSSLTQIVTLAIYWIVLRRRASIGLTLKTRTTMRTRPYCTIIFKMHNLRFLDTMLQPWTRIRSRSHYWWNNQSSSAIQTCESPRQNLQVLCSSMSNTFLLPVQRWTLNMKKRKKKSPAKRAHQKSPDLRWAIACGSHIQWHLNQSFLRIHSTFVQQASLLMHHYSLTI